MVKFWRRRVQPGPPPAQPAVPADLVAWAGEVDVSRLSDKTVRDAEDFLKGYRYMNLDLSQQMGWRVIAAVEAQVTPSPPADAQPLDVIATVLALRRKQLGGAHFNSATDLTGAWWSPNAAVPEGWERDASSGRLERAGTDPGPAEVN
jgi:hypothetical protein